jgi:hypothetical protein
MKCQSAVASRYLSETGERVYANLFGRSGVHDMPTAIVGTYTPEGFVLASDGLGTNTTDGTPTATDVQKIFPIEYPKRILAYALMGNPVIVEDADNNCQVVDIPAEIATQAGILEFTPSRNLTGFVIRICKPIYQLLKEAKTSGRIDQFPSAKSLVGEQGETIARVIFMGYFNGEPSQTSVRFFHIGQSLQEPDIRTRDVGDEYKYGSDEVAILVLQKDHPYFGKYFVEPDRSRPLISAADIARTFIDAWGDPEARKVDPENGRTIGGQTQVYTVTRERVQRVWPVE